MRKISQRSLDFEVLIKGIAWKSFSHRCFYALAFQKTTAFSPSAKPFKIRTKGMVTDMEIANRKKTTQSGVRKSWKKILLSIISVFLVLVILLNVGALVFAGPYIVAVGDLVYDIAKNYAENGLPDFSDDDLLVIFFLWPLFAGWIVSDRLNCTYLQQTFKHWENETETVPDYVNWYCSLHIDGQKVSSDYHNVLLVKDGVVWFVKNTYKDATYHWTLISAQIEGGEETVRYESTFGHEFHDASYMESSGFYSDGKIVLHETGKTVVYDIATDVYWEYAEEQCSFAPPLKAVIQDEYTVLFTKDGESKTFSVENAAEDSEVWNYLWKSARKKIYSGKSSRFEGMHVQTADDKTYLVCRMMTRAGLGYAVVFEYDFENNIAKYCTWVYVSDPADQFYIVPSF